MTNKKTKIDMDKTFKYGVGGGVLGACVGVPGLGLVAGMALANKKEIKKELSKL